MKVFGLFPRIYLLNLFLEFFAFTMFTIIKLKSTIHIVVDFQCVILEITTCFGPKHDKLQIENYFLTKAVLKTKTISFMGKWVVQ